MVLVLRGSCVGCWTDTTSERSASTQDISEDANLEHLDFIQNKNTQRFVNYKKKHNYNRHCISVRISILVFLLSTMTLMILVTRIFQIYGFVPINYDID